MSPLGLIAATAFSLSLSQPAYAQPPSGAVPGHPSLTYFDLMRLVVTDLDRARSADDAEAHTIAPYRHIEGDGAKTDPAGAVWLADVQALETRVDGKPRLAVLGDFGPSDGNVAEFSLLALFDLSGAPRLLDVVEVGVDRWTGFEDKPKRPLGDGSDLFLIDSDHNDADVSFAREELIEAHGDRFHLVAAISTFGEKDACAFQIIPDSKTTTAVDPGREKWKISVDVRVDLTLKKGWRDTCGDDKPPKPFSKRFQATFRWDAKAGRFTTDSQALGQLAKEVDRENSGKLAR